MKNPIDYRQTRFITSAPDIHSLPMDTGLEIAFAGCSNAGKSSAINCLTDQKSLARTSKTPGRTQLINLFKVVPGCNLVDLPGYGYAKVPLALKKKWQESLGEYLLKREALIGLVVVMDIRTPMKDFDQQMIMWAIESKLSVLVLLTKADKLKNIPRKAELLKIRKSVELMSSEVQVEVFSSLKGIGLPQVYSKLNEWFAAGRVLR